MIITIYNNNKITCFFSPNKVTKNPSPGGTHWSQGFGTIGLDVRQLCACGIEFHFCAWKNIGVPEGHLDSAKMRRNISTTMHKQCLYEMWPAARIGPTCPLVVPWLLWSDWLFGKGWPKVPESQVLLWAHQISGTAPASGRKEAGLPGAVWTMWGPFPGQASKSPEWWFLKWGIPILSYFIIVFKT